MIQKRRVTIEVEIDTDVHDTPGEWDWSTLLDAPASCVDDVEASGPALAARKLAEPTIHLNGSSRERLAELYRAAYRALATAVEKLDDAAPHGRDYYPQGPEAFSQAQAEHRARMEAVERVKAEIQTLYFTTAK